MGLAGGSKSVGRSGPARRTRTGRPSSTFAALVAAACCAASLPAAALPFVAPESAAPASPRRGSGVARDPALPAAPEASDMAAALDSRFLRLSFLARFSRTATFGRSSAWDAAAAAPGATVDADAPVGLGVERASGFSGERTAGVWSSSARARFCGSDDGGLGGGRADAGKTDATDGEGNDAAGGGDAVADGAAAAIAGIVPEGAEEVAEKEYGIVGGGMGVTLTPAGGERRASPCTPSESGTIGSGRGGARVAAMVGVLRKSSVCRELGGSFRSRGAFYGLGGPATRKSGSCGAS